MQRNNAAEIALNKKLRLERVLYKEVAAIFRDITAKAGQPFHSVRVHQHDIELALLKHYRRVFAVFGDDYRQEHDLKLTEIQAAMLAADADSVFEKKAARQARVITNTNEKQLAKTKRIAESQMVELQKKNPNLSFDKHSSDLYAAVLLRRVEAISIYETQWSAEFSKAHEVSYLTRGRGVQTKAKPNVSNFKRWDSVGDDRVRAWHAEVDGTVVPVDEPFDVNDEQLMYPGDESLGATASNIVNCRCSVWYEIDEESLMHLDKVVEEPVNKQEDLATAADFERLWHQYNADMQDIHESSTLIKNLDEVLAFAKSTADRISELEAKFESGVPVRQIAIRTLTLEIDRISSMAIFKERDPSLAFRPRSQSELAINPQGISYEPKPVKVSDVPAGFETDHQVAIQRANDEITAQIGRPGKDRFLNSDVRQKIIELNVADPISTQNLSDSLKKNINFVGARRSDGTPSILSMTDNEVDSALKVSFDSLASMMSPKVYSPKMDSIVTEISTYSGVAHADPVSNMIYVYARSDAHDLIYQITHEFGHHIEFDNPAIARRFQDWRKKRIDAAIAKGEQWEFDEKNQAWLIRDGFYHPYISKVYEGGHTEALSMGIEALFDPWKFNSMQQKDPELLSLVWATLRGY